MAEPERTQRLFITLLYLSCGLVVLLFANLYSLYSLLYALLGSSFIKNAPLILPPAIIFALLIAIMMSGKTSSLRPHYGWLVLGLGLCGLALMIPDPRLGVKRIHVTEYLLLSLLVRFTLSHHLSGSSLLFFSCLLTSVLGIHDEFLQGLHPARTYGLKDMLVNAVAGAGGATLWHGLHFFQRDEKGDEVVFGKASFYDQLFLFWLTISVLAMVVPISLYLHNQIPFWTMLPLVAAFVFWVCFVFGDTTNKSVGINIISCCCFLLLVYPVLVNGFQIPFH